jgi:hypothetical protein
MKKQQDTDFLKSSHRKSPIKNKRKQFYQKGHGQKLSNNFEPTEQARVTDC